MTTLKEELQKTKHYDPAMTSVMYGPNGVTHIFYLGIISLLINGTADISQRRL
jgi:hypothetical protein